MAGEKDILYADGLGLKLDIYRPTGPAKRAAILFFHGGGWRAGSREHMGPDARAMADHGFVGLPAQYRLLGEAPFPAQLEDVRAAMAWTRDHATELEIDPDRVILWGSSAGAHLALLAAGTTPGVAAVIAVHPPTAFHVGEPQSRATTPAANLLGEADPAAAAAASPLTYAREAYPPTLLLHGTADKLVHHSASQAMFEALRAVRVPVDLHLFQGHNHGFASIPSVRTQIATEAAYFLDRTVLDPARYQAEAEAFSMFARRDAEARAAASS